MLSLLLGVMFLFSVLILAEDNMTVTAFSDNTLIDKYGNVQLDYSFEAFLGLGYRFGDVVTVSFPSRSIDLSFCSNYSDVNIGSPAPVARDGDPSLIIALNTDVFAAAYVIASRPAFEDKTFVRNYNEGVEGHVQFTIRLKEAGAYLDEYEMRRLLRTNERADYAELSNYGFAHACCGDHSFCEGLSRPFTIQMESKSEFGPRFPKIFPFQTTAAVDPFGI